MAKKIVAAVQQSFTARAAAPSDDISRIFIWTLQSRLI
jgi:hypothetical protein